MTGRYFGAAGVLALATTLLLAATVPAAAGGALRRAGSGCLLLRLRGRSGFSAAGMEIARDALRAEPDHAEALAWQATGFLFRSGQAFQRNDFGRGMALFDKSVAQLSRAVALAPDKVGVLISRASSFLETARFVAHAPTRSMLLEVLIKEAAYGRIGDK